MSSSGYTQPQRALGSCRNVYCEDGGVKIQLPGAESRRNVKSDGLPPTSEWMRRESVELLQVFATAKFHRNQKALNFEPSCLVCFGCSRSDEHITYDVRTGMAHGLLRIQCRKTDFGCDQAFLVMTRPETRFGGRGEQPKKPASETGRPRCFSPSVDLEHMLHACNP